MGAKGRTALQVGLLAVVMAAVAILLAAPACAPSAPDGSVSGPAATDAVAEPTATVTAGATNTLTAKPSVTATGGATSTPATEPSATATVGVANTPTPALAPAPTWPPAELHPLVNAVMVKHATLTAGAASGQPTATRPQTIDVNIYAVDELRYDVEHFLAGNGVSVRNKWECGEACLMYAAVVPVSLLPAIRAHPAVGLIDTIKNYYERLNEHLNPIIAQYDAGLITEEEALAQIIAPQRDGSVLMVVYVDTEANAESVMDYLEDNGIYINTDYLHTITVFVALVPLPLILPLLQQPGITHLEAHFFGYDNDNPEPHIEEYLDLHSAPSSSRIPAGAGMTKTDAGWWRIVN